MKACILADVVSFTCAAGAAPGTPGTPTVQKVKPGLVYELRMDSAVRIAQGKRDTMRKEDLEVQPDAPPLRFRAKAAEVSIAATTSSAAYAWLVPVEEG